MASQGYFEWIAAGQPYTLIRAASAVRLNITRHGIVVFHWPDEDHQKADPPQDHTPYSETGYPGANRRWNARALDVMPRSSSAEHRAENANIARQIIADKNAGVPGTEWIKYLNWTDEAGVCRQERWMPEHTTRASTDRGHIHISGRSDADDNTTWIVKAATYDPVARMMGDAMLTDADAKVLWDHLIKGETPVAFVAMARNLLGGANVASWATLNEQRVNAAADAARDAANTAAIEALTDAITAATGGGTVLDTAAILARIEQKAAEAAERERQTQAAVAEVEAKLVESEAERDRLERALGAVLDEAGQPDTPA